MAEAAQVVEFKQRGNAAHQAGDFRHAIFFFSTALSLNKDAEGAHVLYSNRSASYCMLEDYTRALEDAETVVKLKPNWPKGYSRKALALHNLRQYGDAIEAYQRGLALEPASDLMQKGLEDVIAAQKHSDSEPYDSQIANATAIQGSMQAGELPKLPDVRWHLEVLHDRIWLADPPFAPFRPRSLFIFDSTRLQMLGMAPHSTRTSIVVDEVLDFLAKTCSNHSIRPSVLEVSDARLYTMLQPHLLKLEIETRAVPFTADKQKLLRDTVSKFDEKEREQWKNNNKFAGVLKQRKQVGLLGIKNVTPDFLKYFMDAADLFYSNRTHLYIPLPIGVRVVGLSDQLNVIRVTRNERGVFGLAVFRPGEEGAQNVIHSLVFQELSNIPFDDADDFERYGWLNTEGRYPFPILRCEDVPGDIERPPLSTLIWWEAVLRAVALVVKHTTAQPLFVPPNDPSKAISSCKVQTHGGIANVIVSCPPSDSTVAAMSFDEPRPAPPASKMLHVVAAGTAPAAPSQPAPADAPTSSATAPAPKPKPQAEGPKPPTKVCRGCGGATRGLREAARF